MRAKVSQYAIRHATNKTRSGSHMPLAVSSLVMEVDAKSIGTKRMILTGSAKDRKMGVNK